MTEIEDHKTFWKRSTMEIIAYTEGTLADIIQLARRDILSLITTIESQASELNESYEQKDKLAKNIKELEERIEPYKSDINRLVMMVDEFKCPRCGELLENLVESMADVKVKSDKDILIESLQKKIEIIKTAKERLLGYTRNCRKERDDWQTRAIRAEQRIRSQKEEIELNSVMLHELQRLLGGQKGITELALNELRKIKVTVNMDHSVWKSAVDTLSEIEGLKSGNSDPSLDQIKMVAFNSYDDFSKYSAKKIVELYERVNSLQTRLTEGEALILEGIALMDEKDELIRLLKSNDGNWIEEGDTNG